MTKIYSIFNADLRKNISPKSEKLNLTTQTRERWRD